MNAKQTKDAERLIEWALCQKSPVFETTDILFPVYGVSRAPSGKYYVAAMRLLSALEAEGTVGSLTTASKSKRRVWWLVERIVSVRNVNPLAVLWNSTDDFHVRFGKFPPVASECLKMFDEEAEELRIACHDNVTPVEENQIQIALEAADVFVTVLGALSAMDITREQFFDAICAVAAKNDAKTWQTHYLRADGKIARRMNGGAP